MTTLADILAALPPTARGVAPALLAPVLALPCAAVPPSGAAFPFGTTSEPAGAALGDLFGVATWVDPSAAGVPVTVALTQTAGGIEGFAVTVGPLPVTLPIPGAAPARLVADPDGGPPYLEPDPGAGAAHMEGQLVLTITGEAHGIATLAVSGTIDAVPTALLLAGDGLGLSFATPAATVDTATGQLTFPGSTLHLPRGIPGLGRLTATLDRLAVGLRGGIQGGATITQAAGEQSSLDVSGSVRWDDPLAPGLATLTPTAITLTATWNRQQLALPGAGAADAAGGPIRLSGHWTRDPSSGSLAFSAAVEGGANGALLTLSGVAGKALAGALEIGPGLGSTLGAVRLPAGSTSSSLKGLLAGAGIALVALEAGRVVLHGVIVEVTPAGTRVLLDYSTELDFDLDAGAIGGIRTDAPMRVRHRGVALWIDPSAGGLERCGLDLAGSTAEVESTGQWTLDPPLGSVLRVDRVRPGAGSAWIELDLGLNVDLGVVTLERAIVRLTFKDDGAPVAELRGLAITIDVPGVVSGAGVAHIEHGELDASLEVTVAQAIAARAALRVDGQFVFLQLALGLPAPIPIANSGLGLFGLRGSFAVNGHRALPETGTRVARELQWYRDGLNFSGDPADRGDLALGLGVAIGTLPDLGLAFQAVGTLAIDLPDPVVTLGVDAGVLVGRPPGLQPPGQGNLLGLLTVSTDGVAAAILGHFDVPLLIKAEIPLTAWFPATGPGWFVNLGTDGGPGREGGPASVTILPDLIDARAWGFLMLQGGGIQDLGGYGQLDFDGFAVGFGVGWSLDWSAGPLSLSAGASLVAGLGTNPWLLAGVGKLWGRASLGPLALAVSADVEVAVGQRVPLHAHARVCASVDLLFVTIRACVGVSIGSAPPDEIPAPDSPLKEIAFISRLGHRLEEQDAGVPVCWPDAVPVLEFAHWLDTSIADGPFRDLWPAQRPADGGEVGSDNLRYRFTLTGLDLAEVLPSGQRVTIAGQPPKTWSWRLYGDPPSQAPPSPGAVELKLLTWEPHTLLRSLPDGGAGLPGHPWNELPRVCGPSRDAAYGWAVGVAAHTLGPDWNIPPERPPRDALASRVNVLGLASLPDLPLLDEASMIVWAAWLGYHYTPGRAERFAQPLSVAEDDVVRRFDGIFWLGAGMAPGSDRWLSWFTARFTDPLEVGMICFACRSEEQDDRNRIRVLGVDEHGSQQTLDPAFDLLADGLWIVAFTVASPYGSGFVVEAESPRGPFGVLGVYGLTAAAAAAASAERSAQLAAHDQLQAVAASPSNGRWMLKADTTYEIRPTIIYQARRGGGAWSEPLQFVESPRRFRTARRGVLASAGERRFGESRFDPAALARYVIGARPRDATRCHFRNDPLAFDIRVDYLDRLCRAYAGRVLLRTRRADPPPPLVLEEVIHPWTTIDVAQAPLPWDRSSSPADGLFNETAAAHPACGFPVSGGTTLFGRGALDPDAVYELDLVMDTDEDETTFAKSVFHTSRYPDPWAMLADLGFGGNGPATVDIALEPVAPPSAGDPGTDAAFEAAVDALRREAWPGAVGEGSSLHPWPRTAVPRVTLLWQRSGWALIGVLLDSPEPIHRPGRVELTALAAGAPLPVRRTSRAGDRVLFLAPTPIAAPSGLTLTVTTVEPLGGAAAVATLTRPLVSPPRDRGGVSMNPVPAGLLSALGLRSLETAGVPAGAHVRVVPSGALALPLHPFLVYPASNPIDEVPHVGVVTAGGEQAQLPLDVSSDAGPVTLLLDPPRGTECVLAVVEADPGSALTVEVIAPSLRGDLTVTASDGEPPYSVGASAVRRLRVSGNGTITSVSWALDSDLKYDTSVKPARLGLPIVLEESPWYVDDPEAAAVAADRIAAGAPLLTSPLDPPAGSVIENAERLELQRVAALTAGLDEQLRGAYGDPSTPPVAALLPAPLAGRLAGGAQIPILSSLLLAAVDPGVARWLGLMGMVDSPDAGRGWAPMQLVVATFAVHRDTPVSAFAGPGRLLTLLPDDDPGLRRVCLDAYGDLERVLDSLPQGFEARTLTCAVGIPLDDEAALPSAPSPTGGVVPGLERAYPRGARDAAGAPRAHRPGARLDAGAGASRRVRPEAAQPPAGRAERISRRRVRRRSLRRPRRRAGRVRRGRAGRRGERLPAVAVGRLRALRAAHGDLTAAGRPAAAARTGDRGRVPPAGAGAGRSFRGQRDAGRARARAPARHARAGSARDRRDRGPARRRATRRRTER
jgi:hypothetical protein